MKKIVWFLIFAFVSNICFADVFIMTDGSRYEGKIVKTTQDTITIDNGIGIIKTLNRNQINSQSPAISNDKETNETLQLKNAAPTFSEVKITKLATIQREIADTEYKMDQATGLIYGGPIAAGLIDAGIAYLVKPNDSITSQGISIVEESVALVGIIISGVGLLQYWDGVNTAGQLRAKKYDLMFCPYLNSEKFSNIGPNTLGIAIKLKI